MAVRFFEGQGWAGVFRPGLLACSNGYWWNTEAGIIAVADWEQALTALVLIHQYSNNIWLRQAWLEEYLSKMSGQALP